MWPGAFTRALFTGVILDIVFYGRSGLAAAWARWPRKLKHGSGGADILWIVFIIRLSGVRRLSVFWGVRLAWFVPRHRKQAWRCPGV